MMGLTFLISLSGPVLKEMNRRLKWRSRTLYHARRLHRWLGYFTLLAAQGVIINGGYSATKFGILPAILCMIQTALGIAFFVAFEIRHRRAMRKEIPFEPQVISVSGEEFEERIRNGEQLVILEDLVLDVSDFKADHPGGQFAVEHMIGRDIT
jgi:hypothetical protein